jgi:hypothetical protein
MWPARLPAATLPPVTRPGQQGSSAAELAGEGSQPEREHRRQPDNDSIDLPLAEMSQGGVDLHLSPAAIGHLFPSLACRIASQPPPHPGTPKLTTRSWLAWNLPATSTGLW